MLKKLFLILALSCLSLAQVAQRQSPQQPANVITTGGVGHGYAPTCTSAAGLCPGSDLTLHITGGTTQCVDKLTEYAGGTLGMTDNATNYVYLDPAQDCAHAVNTTGFLQGTVWHYKVTTSGGVITAIDDVRTADAVSKVAITGGGGTGGGTNSSGSVAISGCGVAWTGGLHFTVSPCTYNIAGTQYSSPQAALTLAAADVTFDRIDVIAVDNTSNAIVIQGTPSGTPAEPSVDPATQLRLIAIDVPAGSSTPSGITETDLYLENTEWTCAASSNFNCASTSNPFAGSKDVEASSAVAGNNVVLTKPSSTVDLSTYANLILYIRSKAAWPNAKSLSLFWENGSAIVGASVAVKTGVCGFNSGVTGTYQQCVIPLGSFATGTNPVNKLKIAVAGGGGSIGFYLDNVSIQSGTTSGSSGPQTFTVLTSSPLSGGGTSPVGGSLTVSCPTCGTGSGNVTHTGTLTSPKLIVGNGSADITPIGTPTTCTAGNYALGIDANGNATGCTSAGGTPGGSSGNLQYNNAGAFGGFADGTSTQVLHGGRTFGSVVNADIASSTIDLTTKVTGILPGANGGTGNGFFAVSGPASSLKTLTFPNASATVLTDNAAVTVAQGGTGLTAVSADQVPTGTASNTYTAKTVPDCTDSSGNHLNYTQSTHVWSCGTSSGSVTAGLMDAPPTSAGTLDDEFSGTSLSGSWTVTNSPTTTTTSVGNGALSMSRTGAGGNKIAYIGKATPATPWTVMAKIQFVNPNSTVGSGNWTGGLCIRESSSGKVIMLGAYQHNLSILEYSSYTVFFATNGTADLNNVANYTAPIYYYIQDDGTNLNYGWSPNGSRTVQFSTTLRGNYFTTAPDSVGLCADGFSSDSYLTVDWFRRTQ